MSSERKILSFINRAGGVPAVAKLYKAKTRNVIYAWPKRGIPFRAWPIFMNAGVSERELVAANLAAKKRRK
jgi:hypothetical protein